MSYFKNKKEALNDTKKSTCKENIREIIRSNLSIAQVVKIFGLLNNGFTIFKNKILVSTILHMNTLSF